MEKFSKKTAIKEKEASVLKMLIRRKLSIERIAEDFDLLIARMEKTASLQPAQ